MVGLLARFTADVSRLQLTSLSYEYRRINNIWRVDVSSASHCPADRYPIPISTARLRGCSRRLRSRQPRGRQAARCTVATAGCVGSRCNACDNTGVPADVDGAARA